MAKTKEAEETLEQKDAAAEIAQKSNPIADVLKNISNLSHRERLSLYSKIESLANIDRDKFSGGTTDFDITSTVEEAIKSL